MCSVFYVWGLKVDLVCVTRGGPGRSRPGLSQSGRCWRIPSSRSPQVFYKIKSYIQFKLNLVSPQNVFFDVQTKIIWISKVLYWKKKLLNLKKSMVLFEQIRNAYSPGGGLWSVGEEEQVEKQVIEAKLLKSRREEVQHSVGEQGVFRSEGEPRPQQT